jgi:hypothetical protein
MIHVHQKGMASPSGAETKPAASSSAIELLLRLSTGPAPSRDCLLVTQKGNSPLPAPTAEAAYPPAGGMPWPTEGLGGVTHAHGHRAGPRGHRHHSRRSPESGATPGRW